MCLLCKIKNQKSIIKSLFFLRCVVDTYVSFNLIDNVYFFHLFITWKINRDYHILHLKFKGVWGTLFSPFKTSFQSVSLSH